jgi:hypothetical protein
MRFSAARPDVIRAINQRWLLKFWQRHLAADRLPHWQAVEDEDLSRVSANLSFLDVAGRDGNARFIIRFNGATVGEVYGSPDCRSKSLDEIIPVTRRVVGLMPYRRVVDSGYPVYTIHDVTDRNGRLVHYERLLLPFTTDGQTVDRILASFEFICEDGAFESRELMKEQTVPPTLRLSATIEPRAMV